MARVNRVEIKADNTSKIKEELYKALDLAFEECGAECERYAKMKCPVDTGLLHNSITYALHGKPAAADTYRADNPDRKGRMNSGSYSGSADNGDMCVYVGTNVEYAAYVELGSTGHGGPRPYLKPAVEDHKDKYKSIIEKHLKSEN